MAPRIPEGMYTELTLRQIHEGKAEREINRKIQKAFTELIEREGVTGDRSGKAKVVLTLTLERVPNSNEHWNIQFEVDHKVPGIKQASTARQGGGMLLCQPDGTTEGDPDQMRLFSRTGEPRGAFDPGTGEVIEQDETDTLARVGGAGA